MLKVIHNPFKLQNYIANQRRIRTVGLTSSFLFGLLLLSIMIPLYNVTGVEDIMATTTPCTNTGDSSVGTNCSLTFTSTRLTASADLTVSSTDGTFATSNSSNQASFNLSTNNYTGYILTLTGSSSTTTLKDNVSNNTLDSISSNITLTDFSADNATGKANNNKWGIMPSSYKSNNSITSNNTTTFFPSPSSTNTITMDETTSANSGSGQAKSYTIGLGVRADYTKTAGTYNNTNSGNTIIIAYVANPTNYAITYNKGNTEDTVNSLPSTQGGNVSATSIALSNTIPTRTGYDFKGWCTVMPTTSNNNDSCAGTIYNADGANTAAALTFPINRTTDSNTATLYAMWNIKTFTITRRYRLETATGGWGDYTTEDPVTVAYGGSYTYSKSVTDYKNSASGTNNAGASTSASNVTADQTLSLDFYRNTYTLTVTASTNTSSATGGGTYRWGQTATVGVTKATDTTCITYATPTWTASTGTAPSAGASSSYTMPKSNATVTATSSASNNSFTITFKTSNASSIAFNGTNKSNNTTGSYTCGNYTISGNYASNYEFDSWSRTGSGGFTTSSTSTSTSDSSTTASTYFRVQGAATITLTGKSSAPGQCTSTASCMQTYAFSSCTTSGATLTDARDGNTYSVKKIGSLCWMTSNLKTMGTVTAALSNFSGSDFNIAGGGSLTSGDTYTAARATLSTNSSYPGAYYNYCAASAGTVCTDSNSTDASSDICPSGWRLPTNAEFGTIGTSSGSTTNVSAFGAIYSGYYGNGTLYSTGSYGFWWSSTAIDTTYRYFLYYSSGRLYSGSSNLRQLGGSIRCVKP